MARPREVPGFDCAEPFADAAARIVGVRAGEVFEHSAGVLDTAGIHRVHDMRVATRRLRAAMEMFEPCFPPKMFRKARKEVKALADALGWRRDRDVEIEFLERFLVEGADRDDLERVKQLLAQRQVEQQRANEDLAPFVTADRLEKLRRRLGKLAEKAK
ncbi:MAG TPA: CHAD domain-containing protein [Solirubrobacterales bacterium]